MATLPTGIDVSSDNCTVESTGKETQRTTQRAIGPHSNKPDAAGARQIPSAAGGIKKNEDIRRRFHSKTKFPAPSFGAAHQRDSAFQKTHTHTHRERKIYVKQAFSVHLVDFEAGAAID